MYRIVFTDEARDDLKRYRKHEQAPILDETEKQLLHQPEHQTRNRKRLRPNQVAEWELRAGSMRVFYDVDEAEKKVQVRAIGHKAGNTLVLHGKRFDL